MAVSFTVVGSTVDVSVVDGNFETWQNIFRSGLLSADIAGSISRFRVFRYISGRLVSMHTFANPYRNPDAGLTQGVRDVFDLTYRAGTEASGTIAGAEAREAAGPRNAYAMELLGRPGPSFHYEFQEQGIAESAVATAASSSGWPPANWPYTRYPDDYCYSRWLTVPGASVREYVKHPTVARITAHVKGSWQHWAQIAPAGAAGNPSQSLPVRANNLVRAALIVDTNPTLTTDFPNSNPNIKDPSTGSTASHVSWNIANDQTFCNSQREIIRLTAEVKLSGGSFYNFSLKLREPGYHGWVLDSGNSWQDDVWEWNGTVAGTVTSNKPQTNYAVAPAAQYTHRALWVNLIESSSIDVELFYRRSTPYLNDTANSEF
tara:strand:- start:25828 stop:26952 length:1125 start_codon:yes stop_codon:yes gene_type:complete